MNTTILKDMLFTSIRISICTNPFTSLVMAAILILSIGAFATAAAQQQQQMQRSMITGAFSPAAQQIMSNVQTECASVTPSVLVELCVFLLYESDSTVVLNGDFLIVQTGEGYDENPFFWQAADESKVQGYTVDPVFVSGQGSQGNPHEL